MAQPSLIISSPFEAPTHHWEREAEHKLKLVEGRRPAGYEIFDTRHNTVRGVELNLVNRIRERVAAWRQADYPGVTAITRQLLEHWNDAGARQYRFYFCQIEAIETLIWDIESPAEFRQGIAVPGDGGAWERLCSKMATGTGKTTVMAMIIAWQVLNALTYPKRKKDFAQAIFIVAPGLTVKERLQVLMPGHPANYYDQFAICPNEALRQKLNQAAILIDNWHSLMPLKDVTRSVVKKGAETAARLEHYFRQGDAHWPELQAPNRTLRVDSKVLDKAESGESATADKPYEEVLRNILESADIPETTKARLRPLKKEELLRAIIDNVGKRGTAGQDLQNVISVAMLSEGWDAKNVTHIMGLRAFTSQLLCEQVIGRGLRRVSYDTEPAQCPDGQVRDLFRPEFVNVFGVPLSIFQDVDDGGDPPPPPKPSIQIEALAERAELEISWPNVLRVDTVIRQELTLDWDNHPALQLAIDPARIPITADLAPALGGAADMSKIVPIDLEKIPEGFRQQRLLFMAARKAMESLGGQFSGSRELLVQQLVRLVERFFHSDHLEIPSLFHQEPLRKRILIALSMDTIVQHVVALIEQQNSERLEPVFDPEFPIGSTRLMRTWYTTKPCIDTVKSQISHAVADSTWEDYAAKRLEARHDVAAYAKNDHLGFQIFYLWHGSKRKYVPDYLVRLTNGKMLVLEIKGEDSEQNRKKRLALDAWVRAVNERGGFGVWCWDVVMGRPARMDDVIEHHAASGETTVPIGEGKTSTSGQSAGQAAEVPDRFNRG